MYPMFSHQKQAVDWLDEHDFCGCLFMDIGTGKTRTGLEAFKRLRETYPGAALLVICPLSLIESAWIDDIKKFCPEFNYANLRTGKIADPARKTSIYLVNYDFFITKKFQEKMDVKGEWMCILDESSRLKNLSSLTAKIILQSKHFFKWRICMSATPAPNSELEYWPQITFTTDGVFHPTFFGFRNFYFHLARGKQILPNGAILGKAEYAKMFSSGWKYAITDKKRKILMEKIASTSVRCDKNECLDLPDTLDEIRKIEMSAVQRRHYLQMKNDLITEIKSEPIVATVALTKLMKLRQICSNFAISPEGVAVAIEGANPKMTELLSVLEEVGDRQVIIWAQFHYEIEGICKALGDKARSLYALTDNKDGCIKEFKDSKFRYLVAHPRSAGHGHTFINSNVEIFYSLDYSWESYEQARGRVHRVGQIWKVTYIHLLCADSIEETILECLKRKADAFDLLTEIMK